MGTLQDYQALTGDPNFKSDPEAQSIASKIKSVASDDYQKLTSDTAFKSDADAQQIAHQMRAAGLIDDPAQGGLVHPADDVAGKIASASDELQGERGCYGGYCQRLVRHTVEKATGGDTLLGVNVWHNNARDTMNAFKNAGVGFQYQPGMQLQPGDLVYSGRMGGKDGHAMVVGSKGQVQSDLDPGKGLSMADWVVRPSNPRGGAGAPQSAPVAPQTKTTQKRGAVSPVNLNWNAVALPPLGGYTGTSYADTEDTSPTHNFSASLMPKPAAPPTYQGMGPTPTADRVVNPGDFVAPAPQKYLPKGYVVGPDGEAITKAEAEGYKPSLVNTLKSGGQMLGGMAMGAYNAVTGLPMAAIAHAAGRPDLEKEYLSGVGDGVRAVSPLTMAQQFIDAGAAGSTDPLQAATAYVKAHPNDAMAMAALAIIAHKMGGSHKMFPENKPGAGLARDVPGSTFQSPAIKAESDSLNTNGKFKSLGRFISNMSGDSTPIARADRPYAYQPRDNKFANNTPSRMPPSGRFYPRSKQSTSSLEEVLTPQSNAVAPTVKHPVDEITTTQVRTPDGRVGSVAQVKDEASGKVSLGVLFPGGAYEWHDPASLEEVLTSSDTPAPAQEEALTPTVDEQKPAAAPQKPTTIKPVALADVPRDTIGNLAPTNIHELVPTLQQTYGLDAKQATAAAAVEDAYAHTWAERNGKAASDWYAGQRFGDSGEGQALNQPSQQFVPPEYKYKEPDFKSPEYVSDSLRIGHDGGTPAYVHSKATTQLNGLAVAKGLGNFLVDEVFPRISNDAANQKWMPDAAAIHEAIDKKYPIPDWPPGNTKPVSEMQGVSNLVDILAEAHDNLIQKSLYETSEPKSATPYRGRYVVTEDATGRPVGYFYTADDAARWRNYLDTYHATPDGSFTVENNADYRPDVLNQSQGNRASITFNDDGTSIRRGLASPDLSSAVHEMGHAIRRSLPTADLTALEQHYGVEGGKWQESHEEKFAGNVERYFRDGHAPTTALAKVFAKIKAWMGKIYKSIEGTPLEEDIHPVVKDVLDRAFGGEGATRPVETTAEPNTADITPEVATASGGARTQPKPPRVFGSINEDHTGLTDEGNSLVVQTVKDLGLDKKPTATDADAKAVADSLNLSYDDIEKWREKNRAAHRPPTPRGVDEKLWHKSWDYAVHNLHAQAAMDRLDANRALRMAEEEHLDNPSPENMKAVQNAGVRAGEAQRIHEMTADETSRLRGASGATMQGYNMDATAKRGGGYQSTLVATPTLDEALGERQPVRPTSANGTSTPKPRLRRTAKPAVSDDDLASAVDRYHGTKTLAQGPKEGETLYQRSAEDAKTEALVTIGKYHYERGLRDDDWHKAVENTVGEKVPKEDGQYALALAKSDLKGDTEEKQTATLHPIFVDQLGNELGVKGAASFLQAIGPELRNRLIRGDKPEQFTGAEQETLAREWDKAQPDRKKPGSAQSITTAKQIANDVLGPDRKAAAMAKARLGRMASTKARRDSTPAPDALEKAISNRVKGGKDAARSIIADLNSDHIGKSALDKLRDGDHLTNDEGRRLARAIDAYKRTKPEPTSGSAIASRLTQIIKDARTGRLGYDNPKEAVRTQLVGDAERPLSRQTSAMTDAARARAKAAVEAKVAEISKDLAPIVDDDHQALAKVLMKHSSFGDQYAQYLLGNILSGWDTLEKIGIAHPATVAAEEMRRWLFGNRSEIGGGIRSGFKAVRERGVPEAKRIWKEGTTAANLAGKAWYKGHEGRIKAESRLATHRTVLRLHAAYYQMMQTYNVERGLHLFATEEGRANGLTGKDLDDFVQDVQLRPERYRDIAEKAIKFGEEETQTNPNRAVKIGTGSAAVRAVRTVLLPVANMPLNALGRTIEMGTGLLTHRALARIYEHLHPDATASEVEAYRQKVLQRGAVGAGVTGLGAAGTALGLITPPDEKHGRYVSRVHLPGGHSIDVPAGNVGAMLDTGAVLVKGIKNHEGLKEMAGELAAPYWEDNPYGRALDTVEGVVDAAKGKMTNSDQRMANRAIGGLAVEHLPLSGLTSNMASAIDAAMSNATGGRGGGVRGGRYQTKSGKPASKGSGGVPTGALDFILNAEPVLRQSYLPLTQDKLNNGRPYPQSVLHMAPTISDKQLKAESEDKTRRALSRPPRPARPHR